MTFAIELLAGAAVVTYIVAALACIVLLAIGGQPVNRRGQVIVVFAWWNLALSTVVVYVLVGRWVLGI